MIIRSLAPVVEALSEERYDAPLPLQFIEEVTSSTALTTVRLELKIDPSTQMQATLTVRHVGGNIYDVQGIMSNDPATTRAFTYCLSDDPSPPAPPKLTNGVATYLLDTVERLVGRTLLREQLHQSAAPTTPSPDRPANQAESKTK